MQMDINLSVKNIIKIRHKRNDVAPAQSDGKKYRKIFIVAKELILTPGDPQLLNGISLVFLLSRFIYLTTALV